MLKRVLAYEKDTAFISACRRVLEQIPDDLALRVAVVILSPGAFEFEEEVGGRRTPQQQDQEQARWNELIRDTASQISAQYPKADDLFAVLQSLAGELVQAGNHPFFDPLFTEMAKSTPILAGDLARKILGNRTKTPLAQDWPSLVEKNIQLDSQQQFKLLRTAARSRNSEARVAVIKSLGWRLRGNEVLDKTAEDLLVKIAERADPDEVSQLLQSVSWSSEANLAFAFEMLGMLSLTEIATQRIELVFEALVSYSERTIRPPQPVVQRVLKQLVSVPELDLDRFRREWDVLIEWYPREIFQFVRERIARAASDRTRKKYRPIPSGCLGSFRIPAMAKAPDFLMICDDLWFHVLGPKKKEERRCWVPLFQAVVFETASLWIPRICMAIEAASSDVALLWLARLVEFDGSLIIFRYPEITRAFLSRARVVGGDPVYRTIRTQLYIGCGPRVRSLSEGRLERQLDYVESEAVKAAEAHAADELLGPFYRWIVEIEQKKRITAKMRAAVDMAGWE